MDLSVFPIVIKRKLPRGKGYATEVASFMISYGFEKLYLERIYGHYMSRNSASRKVMEKIGFQFEGTLRHGIKKGEIFEDLDLLGMIRSDYEKNTFASNNSKI